MEHPSVASRRKQQKGYTVMYIPTRERLKAIAEFERIYVADLLDVIVEDYIRGWEKLHKFDVAQISGIPPRDQVQSASKEKPKVRRRPPKRG